MATKKIELLKEVMELFDIHRNEIIGSEKMHIPYAEDCIAMYERYIKKPEDWRTFCFFKGVMKEYFSNDARDEIRFVYQIENMIYEMNHYPRISMNHSWEQDLEEDIREEISEGMRKTQFQICCDAQPEAMAALYGVMETALNKSERGEDESHE